MRARVVTISATLNVSHENLLSKMSCGFRAQQTRQTFATNSVVCTYYIAPTQWSTRTYEVEEAPL